MKKLRMIAGMLFVLMGLLLVLFELAMAISESHLLKYWDSWCILLLFIGIGIGLVFSGSTLIRKAMKVVLLLLLGMSATGCATRGYWIDRGRDAADICTLTVGRGGGAKARVGPIAPALFFNQDYAGIQGGDVFCGFGKYGDENGQDTIMIIGGEFGNSSGLARQRNKYHAAYYLLGLAVPGSPCGDVKYPPCYFTQLEVALGLGGTLKIGFNPGELLDFVLGWTTLDIYSDDLERNKEKSRSNQASQTTPLRSESER